MADIYELYGALASPYSIKMRAVLRYRRLPHVWRTLRGGAQDAALFAQVKAPVIPILRFPDGMVMNDSTPLVFELERRHPGARSVVPDDPAQNFLARVLEDMADEWGTKLMFHFRWFRPRDQEACSRAIAFDRLAGHGRAAIEAAAAEFRQRQVGRMAMVGATPENAPVIEASAARLFALLDALVTEQPYLFGGRPSLADFAWMGQLSQLASDPTPAERMAVEAPCLMRWLLALDDAGGLEPDAPGGGWADPHAALPDPLSALLAMAGAVYLPFLLANARAVAEGAGSFRLDLPDGPYAQAPFKYQVRCLQALREAYAALPPEPRTRVDAVAEAAGFREALEG